LCGGGVRLDHTYGIHMAPGTDGLGLHGGGVPFDPAQYYLVDSNGIHCGLVATQWALRDAWPGEGGFTCVPGSHKAAFATPASVALTHPAVREIPLRAGDVVIFTEALTHGTLPWNGPIDRRTVLYKYSPGNSTWSDNPALPPDVIAQLTTRQRQMCAPPAVAYREAIRPSSTESPSYPVAELPGCRVTQFAYD
jgi:Phytanoyl-CoA dioxygenase (PhyH)